MGRFVYGPVPSRRLGRSLGVDIVLAKSCTVNCVYCQIGSTSPLPPERKRFIDPEKIESELIAAVQTDSGIDYITFSGSGEPTLSSDIGRLIKFAKSLKVAPVCVLTNGTLLSDTDVRAELFGADVVIPNLDAADEGTFQKVNRPHREIKFDNYIEGLKAFSAEFQGKFYLEIVLVKGMNDSDEHLHKLANLVRKIDPDGVWIGTVTRPPSEPDAKPVSDETLQNAREIIGGQARVIEAFHSNAIELTRSELSADILGLLKRRPETIDGISKSLGANPHEVMKIVASFVDKGSLVRRDMEGKACFEFDG